MIKVLANKSTYLSFMKFPKIIKSGTIVATPTHKYDPIVGDQGLTV